MGCCECGEERRETGDEEPSLQSLHPELGTHPAHTLHRREEGGSQSGPRARDLTRGSPWPSRIGASHGRDGTPRVAVTGAEGQNPSTDRTGEDAPEEVGC